MQSLRRVEERNLNFRGRPQLLKEAAKIDGFIKLNFDPDLDTGHSMDPEKKWGSNPDLTKSGTLASFTNVLCLIPVGNGVLNSAAIGNTVQDSGKVTLYGTISDRMLETAAMDELVRQPVLRSRSFFRLYWLFSSEK